MAEMTAAQLQKIENQWLKSNCDDLALAVSHIFALIAEVRRLQSKNECLRKGVDLNG